MKRDWLQIVSNLAIVAGLILLVYELDQARDLSRAELASESWSRMLDQNIAIMGEEVGDALAKHCEGETLSPSEALRVRAFLNHIWLRGERMRSLEAIAGFGQDLDSIHHGIMDEYLGVPMGRKSFLDNKHNWPSHYREAAAEILEQGEYRTCPLGGL